MKTNAFDLFVEINDKNFIFVVGSYDEIHNLKIIEKKIVENDFFNKKFNADLPNTQRLLKNTIQNLEERLDCIFKEVVIILENFDFSCINISGFKKLNGSQVLRENISYILNSLKLAITETEKEEVIIHIFNSQSLLDRTSYENLPIGLYGNFFQHELSFFLMNNEELKKIKTVFGKNNLKIKKILIKDYIEGVKLIEKKKNGGTFFLIKFNKDNINLTYFEKSSFKYTQNFNFGTNLILNDIEKVCGISRSMIEKILHDRYFEKKDFEENEFLEVEYFRNEKFKEIKKHLIVDVSVARIEEFLNLIYNNNKNLELYKKENNLIYFLIEDQNIKNNFDSNFNYYFSKKIPSHSSLINSFDLDTLFIKAANISIFGWKKEAIPIIHTKKSFITRIFKSIFG
tara:strand:+ start:421 stop:1620 length:1200 start_codon:yes stop_codon:yes gene_type:complete